MQKQAQTAKNDSDRKPLVEPGLGESSDGLFFEPAKVIARTKAILNSAVVLAGTLGFTLISEDAVASAENLIVAVVGVVAAAIVAWGNWSQGLRTREAVISPATYNRKTVPGTTPDRGARG